MSSRDEYIKGLRDLADFLESTPDVPISETDTIVVYAENREVFLSGVRAMGKEGRKDFTAYANYDRQFGPIKFRLFTDRAAVCERKVIGLNHVEAISIPAHDEEIVEWECEPWLVR